MIIGGIVSKASGGNFEQGAVTAAVVFLYNDIADAVLKSIRMPVSNADLINERARLQVLYGNKKLGSGDESNPQLKVHTNSDINFQNPTF